MGSVAEKVLGEAACSVLVVKLPRGVPVIDRDVQVAVSPGRRLRRQTGLNEERGSGSDDCCSCPRSVSFACSLPHSVGYGLAQVEPRTVSLGLVPTAICKLTSNG